MITFFENFKSLPIIKFRFNRTLYPNAKDNPYTAVLKGYITRKRDEEIEHKEKVDFFSGIMKDEIIRYKKENGIVEEKVKRGPNRFKHKLDLRK